MAGYHEPVLLKESVDELVTDTDGVYVDATYGGGGHSKEILGRLSKKGKLVAFDQDEDALQNKIDDKRLMLIRSNFRFLKNFLAYHGMLPVNGILADLGISSHQIDTGERGFSTRFDAFPDMRMNRESDLTAGRILNEYPGEKLASVFRDYADLRDAKNLAAKIVRHRTEKKIESTAELMEVLGTKGGYTPQFFAQVFQALRIEVNQELEALKALLTQGRDVLASKGRFVVIAYHSLEDRLVKNFFASGNFSGEVEKDVLTGQPAGTILQSVYRKPVEPGDEETQQNPRARSAKMRVAEKN